MSESQRTVRLAEVVSFSSGGTPAKSNPHFWEGEIPWISGSSMGLTRLRSSDRKVTSFAIGNGTKIAKRGSTLVLVRGMSLNNEIRIGHAMQDLAFNQDVKALWPNKETDHWFLTFALQALAEDLLERVHLAGHGTGVLATERLAALEIWLPPLPEQRRIAGVLGAIDDLIDTNEQLISHNLDLGDAGFLRAFGCRPLGLELGVIADVIDCLHSKKPERIFEGDRVLLQLNNISNDGRLLMEDTYRISEADYSRWTRNFETREDDLVITNVGRVAALARVPSKLTAALGRNMTGIRAHSQSVAAFVFFALRSQPVRSDIESRVDVGTILSALNVKDIPKIRLPESTNHEHHTFGEIVGPILRLVDALSMENNELIRARNELLPLLMSGKIRVREAEEVVSSLTKESA